MPGWEAQVMDCLYSQLVDEWAVPLSSSKECPGPSPGPGLVALRKVHDMLASPEGANVHMHAPFEIRFGGASPEHVLLSPLYPVKSALSVGNSDSGTSGSLTTCFIWLEPVLYRPFNLPLPARHGAFIRRFEDIVRSHEGRAHLTKTHVPVRETVTDGNSVDRLRRWRTIRDKWDPEGMWWNEWLERHWMGTTSMSKEGGEEVEENLMASGGKDVKGRVREIEDGEWEAEGVMGKQSLLRGDGVKL
jgi:D-arabinono-1,4-lactone oxidase